MHASPRAASLLGLAALSTLGLVARPADAQTYSYHEITSAVLGTPTLSPDNSYLDADGITNAGVVVGQVSVAPATPSVLSSEGYEYDTQSGATTLINYQASLGGPGIAGVSGDGSKILGYYYGSDGNAVYFTDSNGSITDLPQFYRQPADSGAGYSAFYRGINSSGATVGLYFDNPDTGHHNGLLRSPDGTFTSLVDPDSVASNPDSENGTVATGINASGTIVGGYTYGYTTLSDGSMFPLDHGFVRSADGTYTNFLTPGGTAGIFLGISDNGNLFGQYLTSASELSFGYFADINGRSITGISVPGSLDGSTTLTGINDSGQISGYFQDTDGVYHGFYADFNPVPEASSVISFGLLLMLGGAAVTAARQKAAAAA